MWGACCAFFLRLTQTKGASDIRKARKAKKQGGRRESYSEAVGGLAKSTVAGSSKYEPAGKNLRGSKLPFW